MATASGASAPALNYSYTVRQPERYIRYIKTYDEAQKQARLSASALQGPFLGFDVEWRPNFVKYAPPSRVALIQLASKHEVLLFQICRARQLPPALRDLLRDTNTKKVGVGITTDVAKLRRDWNIEVRGVVDLSGVAWELDGAYWHSVRGPNHGQSIGLAKLVERYLGVKYIKPKRVQISNWESPLDERQRTYAANDATAAYDLQEYFTMVQEGRAKLPPPIGQNPEPITRATASTSTTATTLGT